MPTITPEKVGLDKNQIADLKGMKGINQDLLAAYKSGSGPANTMNATNLGGTPYKPAPTVPVTGYDALIASSNAAITPLETAVATDKTNLQSKYDRLGDVAASRADGYQEEGVYDKKKAYNDLTNTISQKELAYNARAERVRSNNPTGALAEGQNIELDRIAKDWSYEKANLSIAAAFARDDYTTAKAIVDDKVKAETDGLEAELRGLEFFYNQNYDKLSDEKKNVLEFQIAQIEEEKATKTALIEQISTVQFEAAKNGAPADVILAIGNAKDETGAIVAAGNYVGLLERQREARIGAESGGSSTGATALTPDDKRNLIGGGWTAEEIAALPDAIAVNGIDAVLNTPGMTDAKRAALKKTYGMDTKVYKTRADAEKEVAAKGVDKVLGAVYGDAELKGFANASGSSSWWKPAGVDIKNYYKTDAAKQKAIDLYIQKWTRDGEYKQ